MFNLNALTHAPVQAIPAGYNGRNVDMDMSTPVTFIDDTARIVLTRSGTMDLVASFAHIIYASAGGAAAHVGGPVTITQAHLDASRDWICESYCRYQVLGALHESAFPLEFRNSDVVQHDAWAATPNTGQATAAAAQVWSVLRGDPAVEIEACSNLYMHWYCIVANAVHRDQNSGHNFYSNKADQKRTNTYRAVKVGALFLDAFVPFMKVFGHDLYHLLSTECIYAAADAIVGVAIIQIPAAVTVNGYISDGSLPLNEAIGISESASDRWPIGSVGVAAVVVGMREVAAMLDSIAARATIAALSDCKRFTSRLLTVLTDGHINRGVLMSLKRALKSVIAIGVGYAQSVSIGNDPEVQYRSLKAYLVDATADKNMGREVALWVRDTKIDAKRMSSLLDTMATTLATKLATVNTQLGADPDPKAARRQVEAQAAQVRIAQLRARVASPPPALRVGQALGAPPGSGFGFAPSSGSVMQTSSARAFASGSAPATTTASAPALGLALAPVSAMASTPSSSAAVAPAQVSASFSAPASGTFMAPSSVSALLEAPVVEPAPASSPALLSGRVTAPALVADLDPSLAVDPPLSPRSALDQGSDPALTSTNPEDPDGVSDSNQEKNQDDDDQQDTR